MKRLSRLATVGAVAVLGVGVGASTASAYSISGGGYVGTATSDHHWTFSAYTLPCQASSVTYSGTATGADTTSFTPALAGCVFAGFPSSVTQSGAWSLRVTAGPDGNGYYDGELSIPTGAVTFADLASVCTATISGPQAFSHGVNSTAIRMKNVGMGLTLEMDLNGVAYTAGGSCFASGSDGRYSTSGAVDIPGITIS